MAIGFPAKYERAVNYGKFSNDDDYITAIKDIVENDFGIKDYRYFETEFGAGDNSVNKKKIVFKHKATTKSWGETVTITLHKGVVTVQSKSRLPQIFDWGVNKDNVDTVHYTINKKVDLLYSDSFD